jgi:hypothetical protein
MPYISRAQRLERGKLVIKGALTQAEILESLADYGYTRADLETTGAELVQTASDSLQTQVGKRRTQVSRTVTDADAEKTAREELSAFVRIAQASFASDAATLALLGLSVPGRTLPRPRAAFLLAATALLDAADSAGAEVQAKLTKRGYGAAKRTELRGLLAAVSAANVKQEAAKGEAQQATPDAEDALKALEVYTRELREVAKVALRGKPQLQEAMGIKVR